MTGCSPAACPKPQPPPQLVGSCAPDTPTTDTWLFNITGFCTSNLPRFDLLLNASPDRFDRLCALAADPSETCSLVGALQGDVHRLMARLAFYNATAVPTIFPAGDPSNVPSERPGIEKGAWGPWCGGPGVEPGCPKPLY